MKRLLIEATRSTPLIDFDPISHVLSIKGQSYPENSFGFYEPIFQWIDEYLLELDGEAVLEICFNLPYINTSSTKCIMMLIQRFEKAYEEGKKVCLNWYYDEENEIELECAEEFKEDASLPFYLIPSEQ